MRQWRCQVCDYYLGLIDLSGPELKEDKCPNCSCNLSPHSDDPKIRRQEKWDRDYLALAKFWAELKSKDPSTKVGAVVVDDRNRVVGLGYNGFPKGVNDLQERYDDRPTKYAYVVHAEPNAILDAGDRAHGATLYTWPLFTCNECAKLVIQSGIKRVVSPEIYNDRWNDSCNTSRQMYFEAGVEVTFYG